MDEGEWLKSTDPQTMLRWLKKSGRGGERRWFLLTAGCLRRFWPSLQAEKCRAVEVLERFADGLARLGRDNARGRGGSTPSGPSSFLRGEDQSSLRPPRHLRPPAVPPAP